MYLGVPLCGTLSPGQVCVYVSLTLSLSSLAWMCASASVYPPLCFCSCLSVRPHSEYLSMSLVSHFPPSLSLYISVSVSACLTPCLCVYGSLMSLPLFLHGCVSLCPRGSLSPLPRGVCLCGSVRLFCVSVFVSVSLFTPRLCLCVSMWVYVSISISGSLVPGPRARGRRALLPEQSPVRACGRVRGSGMLGAD